MRKVCLFIVLFFAISSLLAGCGKDIDGTGIYGEKNLYVSMSDSLGNTYTGDSIVIPADKNKINFNIVSNCTWKASYENKAGFKGWMSIPSKSFGGGDATISSSVSKNLTGKNRKVYYFVVTGDSSVINKVVITQAY